MYSKKHVLFVSLVLISLLANGYLAAQLQLSREGSDGARYLIDIAVAKDRISRGMTYDVVIARVHHEPDEIRNNDNGTKVCIWSAMYHYGTLERLLGYAIEYGQYYLVVEFDSQGKVVRVELTEA